MNAQDIGKTFEQELRIGLEKMGWVHKIPDYGALVVEDGRVAGRRFTPQNPIDFLATVGGRAAAIEAKALSYSPSARWTFGSLRQEQRYELLKFHEVGGGYAAVAFNLRYQRTRGIAMMVPIADYIVFEDSTGKKSCFASELIQEFYVKYHMLKIPGGWVIGIVHPFWKFANASQADFSAVMKQQKIIEALPTSTNDERLRSMWHYVPFYSAH